MSKALAVALSALALIQIATPVAAQPDDFTGPRIELLLRQLVTKEAPKANAAALVTRAASFRVTGTIRRVSAFRLPLTCTVFLSDRAGHSEQKSSDVTFKGPVGTCATDIPFKWANADAAGTVDVNVDVSNEPLGFLASAAATANDISRSSILGFPPLPLPLPLQGSTTTVTFDIRM